MFYSTPQKNKKGNKLVEPLLWSPVQFSDGGYSPKKGSPNKKSNKFTDDYSLNPLYTEIDELQNYDFRSGNHIVPHSIENLLSISSEFEVPSIDDCSKQVGSPIPNFIQYQNADQTIKRPGIVLSLKMWNIISHVEFSKDWHNSLNYIIGDNGSGKSSIMAGILLALGVKAARVERKSVKDCINYNVSANFGKSEIVLTHGGDLDPRKYGENIAISRIIQKDGLSKYQVRTAEGKWRSLDRKELNRILITLQIMVDNPLQFLNQAVATKFHWVTDSKTVYTYFYAAMGLDVCENLIQNTVADVEYTNRIIALRLENQIELGLKVAKAKKEYDVVASLQDMKRKLLRLQKEYVWCLVSQTEKEVDENRVELDNVISEIDETNEKLKQNADKQNDLTKSFREESKQLQVLIKKLRQYQEDIDRKRKDTETLRRTLKVMNIQYVDGTAAIKKDKFSIEMLQKQVSSLEKDQRENFEKRQREKESASLLLMKNINECKEKLKAASSANATIDLEVSQLTAAYNEQLALIGNASRGIDAKKQELKNIDGVKRTQYDRFGREMVRLIERIKQCVNANKFNVPPKGPQGACYTVKEKYKSYAPIVEYVMYSTVYSFKVTTQHDQELLFSLISEIYGDKDKKGVRRPEVFWSRVEGVEKAYKLTQKAVLKSCPYPTLLDLLDIVDNDASVINWLVDSKGIEKILMFPTFKEACAIMKDSSRVPKTCSVGYTQDFRVMNPVPNYRLMSKPVRNKANFIQVTSSISLNNSALIQHEIDQMEKDRKALEEDGQKLKADLRKRNQSRQTREAEVKKWTKELINYEKQLENMGGTFNSVQDIDSFREEIEYLTTNKVLRETEVKELGIRINVLKPDLEAALNEIQTLEEEMKTAQNDKNSIESRTNVVGVTNQLEREAEKLKNKLATLQQSKGKLSKRNDEMSNSLLEKVGIAKRKCDRVETNRDPDSVKKEIDSYESILDKNKTKLSQLSKLEMAWRKAEAIAQEHDKENKLLVKLKTCIEQMIKYRQRYFSMTKVNYGILVTENFNAQISTRHYQGELNIDHEGKTLTYCVCTDPSAQAIVKTNFSKRDDGNYKLVNKKGLKDFTAGLSGGERSFSTFCFMIALWSVMDAPFYILDEFEVFMDADHRAKCHQILRDHAKQRPGAQFFIFTPLEIDSMPSPSEASVLRLYPPVRDAPDKRKDVEDEISIQKKRIKQDPPSRDVSSKRKIYEDEVPNQRKRVRRDFIDRE